MEKLSPEGEARYSLLREAINKKYSMLTIIKKYNPSATENTFKMHSILNTTDSNPSFMVNYDKRVWKCFSSGKGGGYMELLYWTQKFREESKKSILQMADEILSSDKDLQRKLGFSSIYKYDLPQTLQIDLRDSRIQRGTSLTANKTFNKICSDVFKSGNDELIIQFISRFELGASIAELQRDYSNTSNRVVTNDAKRELEDLISSLL